MGPIHIIPRPLSLELGTGGFQLGPDATIGAPTPTNAAASLLAQYLRPSTGFDLPITAGPGSIRFEHDATLAEALGPEGYELTSSPQGVVIVAAEDLGLLWAVQTLRQLLPPAIEADSVVSDVDWVVPAVRIQDRPRFSWRGGHLDVSRHFFDIDFIKRFIDQLALHKQNVFHWHLTDDQGWRLQIEKYPLLTEIGAWRDDGAGGTYGGSYTQADARAVVDYAAERGITVVPEIELPGHALAVLAGYPQFACASGPFSVTTEWGVFDDVFCAGNDDALGFLRDVFDEVLDIFPSEFIHVGGDECPKTRWLTCPKCQARIQQEGLADEDALQSWTIRQFDNYLTARGRRLIGWDEILDGGLAPGAAVMSWRGIEGGLQAARAGHDVVMSPQTHVYLDRKHYEGEHEPGRLSVSSLANCYGFDPTIPELSEAESRHIIGVQANVWSEALDTPVAAYTMIFPRMSAVAEMGWTPQSDRSLADFVARFRSLATRFDVIGVNYYQDRAIWG